MTRTVRLQTDISDYVAQGLRDAVASGVFQSESELVDQALHYWLVAHRMEPISQGELQASLERGLSEPGTDADVVFDRLEKKYLAMAEAQELKARETKA